MAGSGPTPNPNSRRQAGNPAHTWTDLPANGFDGPVPEWPIGAPSADELDMWDRYWRKPQAAAWDRVGLVDEVALYVRVFLLGAAGDVKAMTEARQCGERLGLSPSSMLKNRWRIKADDVADKRTEAKPAVKRRLVVVGDDAVAGG